MIDYIQNRLASAWFYGLMLYLVAICHVSGAGQNSAFVLSGNFEDVFAGKHNTCGIFTISAFESNALVDMTFENGFRQLVGTDGHDSFEYLPVGQAVISPGRFPSDAHEFQQLLWLLCVHDPELITYLHTYRFPFYRKYNTNDIFLQFTTNVTPPNLISSIKWYAPNYRVSGTNHYELSMYPNGYLMAEIAVTKTKTNGDIIVPSEVIYKQYKTAPVDLSDSQVSVKSRLPLKSQTDIVPVEFSLFSITNIQTGNPLSSYVPMILDKAARIDDKRIPEMGVARVTSSGKWWTARELYTKRAVLMKPRREVILIFLFVSSLFPTFLLVKAWRDGKKKAVQDSPKKTNDNQ